ncbi:BTB/POZ domain-containing protein 6-like isoform X3 [Oratosquilla oratoria]|uniref:BTB/POZ domain-containing protein 6-like isoform X3 n=1 Tax=Oratosquilla oratoria TaxID=337810 RepID=UPI003F7748B2
MVEPGTLEGEPWQMALNGNVQCLRYLYNSGEYSNLDIVLPGGVCIKAHRLILSMKSPVFGAMLMGPMAATGKQLDLPEDPPEIFRKLLDDMYLDQMNLKSVEEALEVYVMARKYLMEPARKTCKQYIVSNLKQETMLAALEFSIVHGDKELKDKCIEYVHSNLKEETTLAALEFSVVHGEKLLKDKCIEMLSRDPDAVMSSETVTRLSKEALRELLKSDDFGFSSEAVPFKGLIAWGRAQLGPEEEEEPSGSGVRQKIGDDLLKEVRFLSMSCDEFVKNVFDTDVLTHTECFHIQRAITGADLSTLPEDTPLNPTREGRAPKLRKREELSCCKLDLSCSSVNYASFSEVALFEGLSSDATTQLHHMDVNRGCGGTLCVINYEGKTISSATSQNHQYTFTRPAVLVKGKKYRVVYCPSRSVELYRGRSGGSQRVGKTTLSWSLGHTCYSYIWEPTSS